MDRHTKNISLHVQRWSHLPRYITDWLWLSFHCVCWIFAAFIACKHPYSTADTSQLFCRFFLTLNLFLKNAKRGFKSLTMMNNTFILAWVAYSGIKIHSEPLVPVSCDLTHLTCVSDLILVLVMFTCCMLFFIPFRQTEVSFEAPLQKNSTRQRVKEFLSPKVQDDRSSSSLTMERDRSGALTLQRQSHWYLICSQDVPRTVFQETHSFTWWAP